MTEWRTTLKRCLWIVSLISLASSPAIASDHLGVSVDQDQLRFSLVTRNSATVLGVDQEGILVSLWEGDAPALVDQTADAVTGQLRQSGARQVAPVRGGFPQLASLLEIRFSDGVRGTRLRYVTHQVQEGGDSPELRITLEDSERNFQVVLGFRVHPELDLIERWAEVENRGDSVVTLEKLASASLVLDRGSYDLLHASGRWGQEFNIERTTLTGGSKVLEVRGQRFHHLSPWYMVRPSGESEEESGRVWFGSLAWSGNWRLEFEKTPEGDLQILGGINFWDSAWTLEPGGRFTSPVLITGTCVEGPGGASRRLHRYIRNHVLPEGARERVRPVLYNSWYATTFGVSDEQQVTLAKTAQKIGVELFVMDDGWFKGRKDDHAGLGDWTPDAEKFPQGLTPMISAINELGMDFGIWVEPEMVNPDSDLYRAHPDWALHTPGLKPVEGRNQLVLNFARDDVRKYTEDWLTTLLSENPIKFVKWDFNRDIAEVDWPGVSPEMAREVRIRYVQNLYRIYEGLRQRFPELLLEGCAGGGGRVDLGTLSYVDQVWTSDNTNPADRVFIQHGFSHAFPANTMVSWTTDDDWRNTRPSLEYRFRVAMSGVLGVGNDLREWGEEEIEIARREIERYKLIRTVVQFGDLYRLVSPVDSDRYCLQYVSEDRSEAVVFMYNLQEPLPGGRPATRGPNRVTLRGLDHEADYRLSLDSSGEQSAETLMSTGLEWLPRGDYQARIVFLTRGDE